jgi:hypothetical protein
MVRSICLVLLVLAATLRAGPDDIVRVRLQEGTILAGRIVENECTDEILVVRELAGNAKRRIPWSDIQAAQASELRVKLGFELGDTAQGKMTVDGHMIKNKAGVTFRGLLLNEKTASRDGVFELKTSEGVLKIRASDVIEGPNVVRVDVLSIYTAEELYRERLKEKEPKSAEDHFLMGEYCVAIFALDEAKKHYETCLALDDPKYTRDKIQRALDRIERLLADRDALNETREIKKAIHYNNFARAAELIEAFRTRYAGNEALLKDAEDLEKDLKAERDDFFTQRVARQLRDAVKDALANRLRAGLVRDLEALFQGGLRALVHPSFAAGLLPATNLSGDPTLVAPGGFDEQGRPYGVGFTGPLFDESSILAVADAWQRATALVDGRPDL